LACHLQIGEDPDPILDQAYHFDTDQDADPDFFYADAEPDMDADPEMDADPDHNTGMRESTSTHTVTVSTSWRPSKSL
jgi:hypothetical protein